ncbi:PDR/VanB family oxidoreductase [Cellulomonas sp. URHE0023]|uniref:PDR/VanB family oxidoreductase n=1 Tax=Cellulomonas sp. URHE0023 TaxID=1380354 RepID=UPI0004805810|nr:PDR/VanB family oxidoreductase [Cellulomonas sp. URHE0023]
MSVFSDMQRPVVVQARTVVADGVLALDLAPTNGRPLPAWTPGSHVDLLLPGGWERQYSLCGDPADRMTYRVAVLLSQDGAGGSAVVHDTLAVGDTLRLRGPRNHFAFTPAADRSTVFVAGGIGITPMLSMIAAADAAGTDWSLHYAGRSRATMAFVEELVADHPSRVRVYAADEGERLAVSALTDGPAGRVFCCGPRRLLDAVEEAGTDGWSVHTERFEAREFGPPVWPDPFEVELALSGTTLTVDPGQSILDVVEASGAVVVSSCRVGTCGSCETPVLQGSVEHRDSVIGPGGASQTMMICVSRAAGPGLVLEL